MKLTSVMVAAMMTTSVPVWAQLIEPVRTFVDRVEVNLESLPEERKVLLAEFVDYVAKRAELGQSVKLVFICTHNSRRSQLAQIWCQIAATHYNLPGVETYSGGTEATACNIRTIHALRRAGLSVVASTQVENPVYLIQFSDALPPLRVFSKVIAEEGNPRTGFAALLCCSDADDKCPVVHGCDGRFALHYDDPKSADNSPEESQRYDQRNYKIAQEMFYVMSKVARLIK